MVIGILIICCWCTCSISSAYSMFFGNKTQVTAEKFSCCNALCDSEKNVELLMAMDKKIVDYNNI